MSVLKVDKSSISEQLFVSKTNLPGKCTFSVAEPKLWNEFPITFKSSETIATSRNFFKIAFPTYFALVMMTRCIPVRDVTLNDSVRDVTLNDSVRDVTLNDSVRDVTLNDSVRDVTLNDSVRDVTLNDSVRDVTLNDSVSDVTLNDSVRDVTLNDSVRDVTLNDSALLLL